MKIADEIETLACEIAKKAIDDSTPFAEKLDALKSLTTYYALRLKTAGRSSDDEAEPSIVDFQARLRASMEDHDGGCVEPEAIPARRGRREPAGR